MKPDEPLLVAYGRMKQHDVSQLPVLQGGRIVGMLDESDLLAAAAGGVAGSGSSLRPREARAEGAVRAATPRSPRSPRRRP